MVKVSVIVPVYNIEVYVEQCIQSILAQTIKDFELILVNDGSTDRSGEICMRYAKQEERIHYIAAENHGPGPARNTGIDVAAGEWICFVDGDDYLPADSLEKLLAKDDGSLPDIIIGMYSRDIEGQIERINWRNRLPVGDDTWKWYASSYLYSDTGMSLVTPWGKLYRKTFIQTNTLRFPALRKGGDFLFNSQAYQKNAKVVCSEENVYFYCPRGDSITARYDSNVEILTRSSMEVWGKLFLPHTDWESRQMYALKRLKMLIIYINTSYCHPLCRATTAERMAGIDGLCEIVQISELYGSLDRKLLSPKERIMLTLFYRKWYRAVLLCYKGERILKILRS